MRPAQRHHHMWTPLLLSLIIEPGAGGRRRELKKVSNFWPRLTVLTPNLPYPLFLPPFEGVLMSEWNGLRGLVALTGALRRLPDEVAAVAPVDHAVALLVEEREEAVLREGAVETKHLLLQ